MAWKKAILALNLRKQFLSMD